MKLTKLFKKFYMLDRSYFYNKKILITGGLGFIGSNLALRLVDYGAQVRLVDALVPGHGANFFNILPIQSSVRVLVGDMTEQDITENAVKDSEIIFNLAGQVSHEDSMSSPFTDLTYNTSSHISLLEACKNNNRKAQIIFTSTRQIYGKPQFLPVSEDHQVVPPDVNGINKYSAEQYHQLYHRVYGIPTKILRLTNTYGPRQLIKHNRQGFMGVFIRKSLLGERLRVFGDGQQRRDLTHVDDVVDALCLCAQSDGAAGKVFNVGAPTPLSLFAIAETFSRICQLPSVELVPFPKEKLQIDIGDFYADYSRFSELTGWSPRINPEQGIASTLNYFKQNLSEYLTSDDTSSIWQSKTTLRAPSISH
jgi:UDP-glucose 4-epimerase